jgi:hypothetical protein
MKVPKTGIQKKANIVNTKNTMNISIYNLDILCKYIITDPAFIKISNVSLLNNMINELDPSVYEKDAEKTKRINFIRAAIEARLKYNLNDKIIIIQHIISKLQYTPDFIDLNTNLSINDINWCNNLISDSIKFSYLNSYLTEFMDVSQSIQMSDFDHRGDKIEKFQNLVNMINNEFRKAKINDSIADIRFNLDPREFDKDVEQVYNVVISPSRRLKSGMQGLNTMLAGGFESSRVYMILGITGVGKSITLLNIAYQIKKYNSTYKPKDPSKIPTIVYLTMENSVIETVTRLYDFINNSSYGMNSYSLDEVISKFKNEGQLVLTDKNPINFMVIYKPNRSVDTSYLYTLYDDLLDEGYEMMCLIQDHLLRIRSVYGNPEPRYELGDIVNEFKTFATLKDIPVISNFHLNRDAMKIVESYSPGRNQADVGQKLGKSNVSESVMILNNADCVINIQKDEDEYDGTKYLGFNLSKARDKTTLYYFAQPFAYGGEIRLIEDVNGPPMYKEQLHSRGNAPSISNVRTSSANAMNSINNIAQLNGPIDASFFDTPQYNTISEFDEVQEPVIRKKVAIDPFIRGLPKEDPRQSILGQMGELDKLKSQLQK